MISSSRAQVAGFLPLVIAVLAAPVHSQQWSFPCDTAVSTLIDENVLDRATQIPLRSATVTVTWHEAGGDREATALTDSVGHSILCIPKVADFLVRVSYRDVRGISTRTTPVNAALHAH